MVIEIIFYFLLFGVIGISQEVIWRGLTNFQKKDDPTLMGTSSLWMFPIYGSVFFFILLGQTFFPNLNIFLRGLIYMTLILLWEYTTGFVIKKIAGKAPWNYSREKIKIGRTTEKTNLDGLICFSKAGVWYVESLIAEALYLFLNSRINF